MITGTLKKKIDDIRQVFYNENMAQPTDIVTQLTILMFIKMLDDKQTAVEAQSSLIGIKPNDDDLTFKNGNYVYKEKINGQEHIVFQIPYEDLRWKNFKNLNTDGLAKRIKNNVIPFIKDQNNKAVGKFARFAQKYSYGFDDKERLLATVVDKLSDEQINFTNTDLIGDVYEYICGSGISGQFRTPRHIIDMAVEMMKPKLGEKIIDPAMGTAGFIIESAKYISKHQANEKLNKENNYLFNNEMFYGCDTDTNMARIGYMNSILHNIKNPQITIDSLLEHDNAQEFLGKFDLVLQNPPFAGSIVKSAINTRLLKLTNNATNTELLFVALMILLLKLGGRGMSIVPDGLLYKEAKGYRNLRKELVDNQRLVAVISMHSSIFKQSNKKGSASKGTGVKTSFIIFQKTNNGGTDKVWFYDMSNDGFSLDDKRLPVEGSNIPDIINRYQSLDKENERSRSEQSFFVPVEEIRQNDYILAMSRYKDNSNNSYEYEQPDVIFEKIKKLNEEIEQMTNDLSNLLND